MKKIFVLLLLAAMTITFAGCGISEERHVIYFASGDGKTLAEERVKIEENLSLEKKAYAITEKLLGGPYRSEHKRVIPENTALLGLRIEGKTVTVNLSQDFEKTENHARRLLSMYSLVNTLCALDGINDVQILVNGRKIKYTASEEEVGTLSMNNVITADEIGRNQTIVLELYFANEEKDSLISEKRMLDIKDNETAEKTAIGELMKGPSTRGVRLITEDVKVLSVETKEQYCYVNFSKEFLSIPEANSELCVYSIVNTLTRLPEISWVQFLVEGEKAEKLGDTVISELFTYNAALVD